MLVWRPVADPAIIGVGTLHPPPHPSAENVAPLDEVNILLALIYLIQYYWELVNIRLLILFDVFDELELISPTIY